MQIISVRGTMISRVNVSDSVNTFAQHFGNLGVEIVRLDQTIYGGLALVRAGFFQLLIVRQIIPMTFRSFCPPILSPPMASKP